MYISGLETIVPSSQETMTMPRQHRPNPKMTRPKRKRLSPKVTVITNTLHHYMHPHRQHLKRPYATSFKTVKPKPPSSNNIPTRNPPLQYWHPTLSHRRNPSLPSNIRGTLENNLYAMRHRAIYGGKERTIPRYVPL